MSTLLVIDGTYLIYKSWYRTVGIRDKSIEAMPIEQFLKIARNDFLRRVAYVKHLHPFEYLFLAFDPEGGNFRYNLLPTYKADRDEKPHDLLLVKTAIYDALRQYKVAFQIADYAEGDDLIASFIAHFPEEKIHIFSGDKDLAALVSERVTLLLENGKTSGSDKRVSKITVQNFHRHFPVPPALIPDFKALQGDKSDSIKGVDGLYRTQALHLLMEYGTLENYFLNGRGHHLYPKLLPIKEKILINKKVASIIDTLPIQPSKHSMGIASFSLPPYLSKKVGW